MRQRIQPDPDRIALEIAHKRLCVVGMLDAALRFPALKKCIENVARRHMQRRAAVDVKKLQANDHD